MMYDGWLFMNYFAIYLIAILIVWLFMVIADPKAWCCQVLDLVWTYLDVKCLFLDLLYCCLFSFITGISISFDLLNIICLFGIFPDYLRF